MIKPINILVAIAFSVCVLGAPVLRAQDQPPAPSASPAAPAKDKVQYTCPMHPEIVKDKPDKCPKCGMKLVEKK